MFEIFRKLHAGFIFLSMRNGKIRNKIHFKGAEDFLFCLIRKNYGPTSKTI